MAVTEEEFRLLKENLDQFFQVVMGMIIMFMQCGFAFLEAGAVRSKNTTNILIKNLLDSMVAGIAYWIIGYPLAYGNGNFFLGYSYFASWNLPDTMFAHFFFQYVFAATAATIVSGAVAERCEFIAYLIVSFLITSFIYPVVTHWAWHPEGWLAAGLKYDTGNGTLVSVTYEDFAGSGVVHVVGGVAGFVGALSLGPRLDRFKNGSTIPGHSVPLAALGGFILIFGFLAFNGGSGGSISGVNSGATASISVVNTIISASVSATVSLMVYRILSHWNSKSWSFIATLNGTLTGMVAACAGCDAMYPWGATVVGLLASVTYCLLSYLMIKLKVDDPLDAVAVHFGGGMVGVLSQPFLKKSTGIVFNWDKVSAFRLLWQLAGLSAIMAWTAITSLIIFAFLGFFGFLRISKDVETTGMDLVKHGEPAYPAISNDWVVSAISSQVKRRAVRKGDHINVGHKTAKYVVSKEDMYLGKGATKEHNTHAMYGRNAPRQVVGENIHLASHGQQQGGVDSTDVYLGRSDPPRQGGVDSTDVYLGRRYPAQNVDKINMFPEETASKQVVASEGVFNGPSLYPTADIMSLCAGTKRD